MVFQFVREEFVLPFKASETENKSYEEVKLEALNGLDENYLEISMQLSVLAFH